MKFLLLVLALVTANVFAKVTEETITVNAAEYGIGKFHRKDNSVHQYTADNAWKVFVLADQAQTSTMQVIENENSTYTIYYTNLEELLNEMVKLSAKTGKKIGLLNMNAHGLPGGMWFPKDAKTRDSMECGSWRTAARGSDEDNYGQYYSTVSKEEIESFTRMSRAQSIPAFNCLTGLNEWTTIVSRVPAIKASFSEDAQIHMHSCLVGLGTLGENFTLGIAKLLFSKGTQQVQTSIKFGLGDWSMEEGMGFWTYESDEQMERDNAHYPVAKRDRDMMQKGDIRVAQQTALGTVKSGLIKLQDFMFLTHDTREVKFSKRQRVFSKEVVQIPTTIRIPGTRFTTTLK